MQGRARRGPRTKELLLRLRPREVAVLDHEDLDELAAEELLRHHVAAVVNASRFATGRYPNRGPRRLLSAGVRLVEGVGGACFQSIADGEPVELRAGQVWQAGRLVGAGHCVTAAELAEREHEGQRRIAAELVAFLANTLDWARREQDQVLAPLPLPPLRTRLAGRPAVVVARGADYREDLRLLRGFIREARPALVGVDGGADALAEQGLRPDLIVGDMDSVSDRALAGGAELVVHAYGDGRAPGLARLERLGLKGHVLPAPGTSEDLALLLAYEAGAEPIVTVGSHRGLVDFLAKGRPGMASTLLVRLKLGHVLVDARGTSRLFGQARRRGQLGRVAMAALLPLALVVWLAPATHAWLHIWLLELRLGLGL